jgi:DNA helicase-2/ATP-dependent DNA helicase PcrA
VAHGAGPARVIAPAGSGKTRVLTERLRHLTVDRRLERETLLAVAYNKRAQHGDGGSHLGLPASGPDAQRARVLAAGRGSGPPPQVLEEREVRALVEELVPARRAGPTPTRSAPTSRRCRCVRPRPARSRRGRGRARRRARPRRRVRAVPRRLAAIGAIDFDEQIYAAVELPAARRRAPARAQARCRHLLVDELQDLTPAHVLMVRLLATPGSTCSAWATTTR